MSFYQTPDAITSPSKRISSTTTEGRCDRRDGPQQQNTPRNTFHMEHRDPYHKYNQRNHKNDHPDERREHRLNCHRVLVEKHHKTIPYNRASCPSFSALPSRQQSPTLLITSSASFPSALHRHPSRAHHRNPHYRHPHHSATVHRPKPPKQHDVKVQCEVCSIKTVFKCCGCSIAYYCSRLHQKKDWFKHKRYCKIIAKFNISSSSSSTGRDNDPSWGRPPKRATRPYGPQDCFIDAKALRCYEQLVRFVFRALTTIGMCVIDNFVHENIANGVLFETKAAHVSPPETDGSETKKEQSTTNNGCKNGSFSEENENIEISAPNSGEKQSWVTGKEKLSTNIQFLIQTFQNLIDALRLGEYGHGRLTHRSHVKVSCYSENSKGFAPRVDNPSGEGCFLTTAYHCNRSYQREACGGVSRYYFLKTKYVDIEPRFNRAVIRWSDKRILHEKQPSQQTLFSLTTWYFDFSKKTSRHLSSHQQSKQDKTGHSTCSNDVDDNLVAYPSQRSRSPSETHSNSNSSNDSHYKQPSVIFYKDS